MESNNSKKLEKPGVARSLLQRVASNTNVHTKSSSGNESPQLRTDVSPSSSKPSPLSAMPSTVSLPSTSRPAANAQPGPASIEQSVRMFRLYEALRNGDTAAISKAIKEENEAGSVSAMEGSSVMHLAVQCAEVPVVEFILSSASPALDINERDKDGNTPLHIASTLGRAPVVRALLDQTGVNDSIANYQGRTPLDLAKNPEVFQMLQLARSVYVDARVKDIQGLVHAGQYDALEKLLADEHFKTAVDVNSAELATDPVITESGGTLLHEAARKRDAKLIQILLLNGADPFQRDRRGKLPQDITKDDKTRAILKKSPAAAAAQRGIQEKTILGSSQPSVPGISAPGENALSSKESREMKGYLKKWTNYTSGYKLRWFVLEDGVMSYYKHQDDAGSACRGAINMKIARLHMDPQDKLRFEVHGKSSVKYHLKANHQVEAKRWFWALNNAIQFAKDEAKEEARKQSKGADMLKAAKLGQIEKTVSRDPDSSSIHTTRSTPGKGLARSETGLTTAESINEDDDTGMSIGETSVAGDDSGRPPFSHGTTAIGGDADDEEEFMDEASELDKKPVSKDAFMITAHSVKLQLDLLTQLSSALQDVQNRNPSTMISDPIISQALSSYEAAISNLNGLMGDLARITRDRESYWNFRLEQEMNVRRVWEDSMARVAQEQEQLQKQIDESEEKRKRTRKALKDALEGQQQMSPPQPDRPQAPSVSFPGGPLHEPVGDSLEVPRPQSKSHRRKSTIAQMTNISDSESEEDEEFFDAVGAGEVEIVEELPPPVASPPMSPPSTANAEKSTESAEDMRAVKDKAVATAYKGYDDEVRRKLKLDADNRPRISLWGVLKNMIGKDMTKMTLPVSFNEPTSLLQRQCEDLEYTELLDTAAERTDSTERMIYVAAYAASEYSSAIGRVAKPFNPLLGETFEYVRPDKGYRFFIEQVSHHPPVGAAWAESKNWDYYGESNVKSKFYGKSFEINHLGTWFVRLRPIGAPPGYSELYTWKKATNSVIGIITGSPAVDVYGPVEITNHMTGEKAYLDFKQRGWKASSAYQMQGKVVDANGKTRWSIGGRWNDKIYARMATGYEDIGQPTTTSTTGKEDTAFLVWEAAERPSNIPFNLTPFVVTMNAIPERLKPHLPPTDTRFRPDQRAMEDGEYDKASSEKNRVEEKQRAKRRIREQEGSEWTPRWFTKKRDATTGESFWEAKGASGPNGETTESNESPALEYWHCRNDGDWTRCDDIF